MTQTRTPTTPENQARITAMVEKVAPTLGYLASRWLDEREFEDIAEYQKVLAKEMPAGFELKSMTKRPFGFKFAIGTEATYHAFCTSRSLGWKRLT